VSSSDESSGQTSGITNALIILQLLYFTYTKTNRDDPVFSLTSSNPGLPRENELRKLVTCYAACKVRELASYEPPFPGASVDMSASSRAATAIAVGGGVGDVEPMPLGFRDLLDEISELASDLVYRMM
jgi:hypothetical protein